MTNCIVTLKNQVNDNYLHNQKGEQEMKDQLELEIQQLEKWKKSKKFYKDEYDKQNIEIPKFKNGNSFMKQQQLKTEGDCPSLRSDILDQISKAGIENLNRTRQDKQSFVKQDDNLNSQAKLKLK